MSSIRGHLADPYSHTGRPSVDPELLIRMLLVGYCFGIRSERRLCDEVHLNLAYRWFCHLDLSDRVPDHSTFSKNRHGRFRESELLRHLFEVTVARGVGDSTGVVSAWRTVVRPDRVGKNGVGTGFDDLRRGAERARGAGPARMGVRVALMSCRGGRAGGGEPRPWLAQALQVASSPGRL